MKITAIFLLAAAALLPAARPISGGTGGGEPVRVSVFGFETSPTLAEGLGAEVAELVNARLSVHPGLRMVERSEMERILAEQGLSRTAAVDQEQAIRIGRMVGAEILVTGRVFPIDGELVIVARIIGSETTRVFGSVVKGRVGEKASGLIDEAADRIAAVIVERKAEILPAPVVKEDRLALIRQAAEGRELPLVSVGIYEEHNGRPAVDSIAGTELAAILRGSGFEVIEQGGDLSPGRVREYLEGGPGGTPRISRRVDVLLIGEAFTETADHPAPLITGKGRVEVRALEAASGRILAIARRTGTEADLAERSAAAAALEKATLEAAAALIPEMLNHWKP